MSIKKSPTPVALLFFACLSSGCATDDPDPALDTPGEEHDDEEDADSKPDADTYVGCAKGDLESDMTTSVELAGPGINPETGELTPGTYHIATTYLAIQPGKLETAIELSGPIIESSFSLPGFVAMTIVGSESCNTLRTLTVWESEEAMFAFVASPSHARAMAKTSEVSRGSSNTITWDGDVDSVSWDEAARRLGLEEDGDI